MSMDKRLEAQGAAPAAADGLEAQRDKWKDRAERAVDKMVALRQELVGLVVWMKEQEDAHNTNSYGRELPARFDSGVRIGTHYCRQGLQAILDKHFGAAPEQGGEKR